MMTVDAGDNSASPIALEFWDLSNPREPRRAHRHADSNTARLREAHSLAVSTSYGGQHVAFQAQRGVQIWDLQDPANPQFESELILPNIQGVYGSIWWLFWQAPYLYVAGSSAGLYIARVDDVRNPTYLKTIPPNQLAGLAPSQVFACGNLLILRQSKEFKFVTLDAEDPENPVFVQTVQGARGYSSIFAAGKFLTSGGDGGPVQMFVHDVSHTGQLTAAGSVGQGFGNGAYGSYQDGFFHTGMSNVYAKIDIANLRVVGTANSGIANRDEDFCQVFGNLAFVGDDHGVGSGLYVHDTQPDTRGPEVHWVHPADGATDVALSSRIGVSMSDNLDFQSLDASTFVVRPVGGAAVAGHASGPDGSVQLRARRPVAAQHALRGHRQRPHGHRRQRHAARVPQHVHHARPLRRRRHHQQPRRPVRQGLPGRHPGGGRGAIHRPHLHPHRAPAAARGSAVRAHRQRRQVRPRRRLPDVRPRRPGPGQRALR